MNRFSNRFRHNRDALSMARPGFPTRAPFTFDAEDSTMPSKIQKNGRARWKARVQKHSIIRQKLFDTKHEALAWEVEQRKTEWAPDFASNTVRSWAHAYLEYAAKFNRKTRNEKKQAFRAFFEARHGASGKGDLIIDPDSSASGLTPAQVLAALRVQFLSRGGNAANKDRKNLVAAWNWGVRYMNLPERNPCRIDKFPEQRTPRYVPPEEDFWKVYALAGDQDRLILMACLHLGARKSEIFNLLWEDVDFANRRIRLATRKRRDGSLEHDWLPMTGQLHDALVHWRDSRALKIQEHIFACGNEGNTPPGHPRYGKPYKERMQFLKRLCAKANVRSFGFHSIRHLTASILYRLGQPVSVIQCVLRHKSPTTTTIYLKSLGLEEARNALEDLARQGVQWSGEKSFTPHDCPTKNRTRKQTVS